MKFNYKRITAIATSALMVCSTMGIAAAANYPQPFVVGGTANVAIVYGTGAGVSQLDMVEAANILKDLSEGIPSAPSVGSESIQLERGVDEFNLGDNVTDFYTTIDVDDLGTVLADGVYYNKNNRDSDYEQTLTLMSNMQMTHFRDRNYENYGPTIGIQLAKTDNILNYTLEFTPNSAAGGTDFDDLESTFIEILGKEYFISEVSDDGTTITLLDSATTGSINLDETTTVNVGGDSYEISISALDSENGVIFNVNGQNTNRLGIGDTQKISGGDAHIGVTDFQAASFAGDVAFAKFSLGTGEIVLENGEEVEINGDAVSQMDEYDGYKLNAYVTNDTTTTMESIVLEWLADDNMFLTSESELVMPGFESVKFTMGDFITDAEEKVTFNTGDPFSVTTSVKDGSVTIDLFYLNAAEDAFATNLGASVAQHLITNATGGTGGSTVSLNLDNETYFVASWVSARDAETYVYELSNIKDNSGKNETTLVNLADGSNVVFKDTKDTKDVGRIKLTLTAADVDAETATILVEPVSGGSVYTDRVFTAEGLQFRLPWINSTDATLAATTSYATDDLACDTIIYLDGQFYTGTLTYNSTANLSDATDGSATCLTSWDMNFTEEDVDGNIANDESFQVTFSVDADDGIEANGLTGATALQIGRTGDDYIAYVQSDLATRIDWTKDTSGLDAMEVTYHGTEAYAEVFVSSTDATGTIETGAVLVKDTEVSSVKAKNLIVVGGSCINSAAASLVGGAYCGAAWTQATGVGSGQFLIKSYSDSSISDKVALLVAGYEAADTVNAATYLRTKTVDTSEGGIGTTSAAPLTAFE